MAKADDTGITPFAFAVGTIILVIVVGAIVWFAIPGPDAKHRFASPTGRNVVELGENCAESGCIRVAIREQTAADGSKTRRGCHFEIVEQRPMLLNAYPLWAPDETTVDIVYADAEGVGGKFTLDLDRDCTIEG